jgi:hypothetical protein
MSTTTTITETPRITADNVLHLFPEVVVPTIGTGQSASNDADMEGYDEEQIRLMDEVCIVLDENDLPIATGSKKLCMYFVFALAKTNSNVVKVISWRTSIKDSSTGHSLSSSSIRRIGCFCSNERRKRSPFQVGLRDL